MTRAASERPEVWDCFLFNNELELLDYRFLLLDAHVDRFVVVEATRTFAGDPKPCHLEINRARYEAWQSKIERVVVDLPVDAPDAWARERAQRFALGQAIEQAPPDTLVVVGDVDEVPHPEALDELRTSLTVPTRLVQRHAIYYANWEVPIEWADGTMACRRRDRAHPDAALMFGDPDAVWRKGVGLRHPRGGWHLSYLGGRDAIDRKFREFSHQEFNNPIDRSPGHLRLCLALGVDYAGRYVLHRNARDALDPMLEPLLELHPELFDFSATSRPWLGRAYREFVRARRSRRLHGRALRAVLGHRRSHRRSADKR